LHCNYLNIFNYTDISLIKLSRVNNFLKCCPYLCLQSLW